MLLFALLVGLKFLCHLDTFVNLTLYRHILSCLLFYSYTYGKPVVGQLEVKLGVLIKGNNTIAVFNSLPFSLALSVRVRSFVVSTCASLYFLTSHVQWESRLVLHRNCLDMNCVE